MLVSEVPAYTARPRTPTSTMKSAFLALGLTLAPASSIQAQEPDEPQVWVVHGRVTDGSGAPLAGVQLRAHCGLGSLQRTGVTESGEDGRYRLEFGPGGLSGGSVPLQAASIFAAKPGWFETNLCRQGELSMAGEAPEDESWLSDAQRLVLPGQPLALDFQLQRGGLLEGVLVDPEGRPLPSRKVVLRGEQLPPSSNVLDVVRTDRNGRFVFDNVPTTFDWELSLRSVNPSRRELAGPLRVHADRRTLVGVCFRADDEDGDGQPDAEGDAQRGVLWMHEWAHHPWQAFRPRWRAPLDWVEVYAGEHFSLVVPPDWVRYPVRGIDSYVGQFRAPGVQFNFDVGVYSSPLTEFADRSGYTREEFRSGGYSGELVRAEGFVGVHFPDLGQGPAGTRKVSLGAFCETPEAAEQVEAVLRSLAWPLE